MIKLFRNIRQKLLVEGKTINYLKYAIGEIVLVMIGILLALQVNNWNENRKGHLNELKLVKQLIDDARADSIFFESRIKYQQIRDTLFENLLNLSNNILVDSISTLEVQADPFFFRLAYQSNLINNNPDAYEMISSDTIKTKLREYIMIYDYVVNAIELNNRIVEEYGIPMSIKYYEQFNRLPSPLLFRDISFILNDRETIAKLDLFKTYGINYLIQCQKFLEINQELKLLLETYLNESQ
jgi:hypothetical protein